MGTRSTIGVVLWDNTIESIYCHWDGYPNGVGAMLAEHYTCPAKIDALLALGDISTLEPEIGEQHDFDNPTDGWTLAYGRDRGDEDITQDTHASIAKWKTRRRLNGCEFGYLWNGSTWETFNLHGA